MKIIKLTSQFKKDLKRYQNNPRKMDSLERIVKLLRETGTVPNVFIFPQIYSIDRIFQG